MQEWSTCPAQLSRGCAIAIKVILKLYKGFFWSLSKGNISLPFFLYRVGCGLSCILGCALHGTLHKSCTSSSVLKGTVGEGIQAGLKTNCYQDVLCGVCHANCDHLEPISCGQNKAEISETIPRISWRLDLVHEVAWLLYLCTTYWGQIRQRLLTWTLF